MLPSEMAAQHSEQKKANQERRTYYLKLSAAFFEEKVIRKLRMLPGGDTYIVIILELFIESLKSENRLFYDGVEDSLAKELALTINEKPEAIQVVLDALTSYGWLIEEDSGSYFSPKCAELSGSISARTERWQRQRKREEMARIAESLPDNCQQIADDCRKLPQYKDISRDIDISRNRDKGRNEGERELYELFPDGFEISKPKIIPTLSEVANLCKSLKTRNINPEEFYRHFEALNWSVDGRDITDWQILLYEMEIQGVTV